MIFKSLPSSWLFFSLKKKKGRDLEDERHEKVGKSGLLSLRKRKLNGSLLALKHGFFFFT